MRQAWQKVWKQWRTFGWEKVQPHKGQLVPREKIEPKGDIPSPEEVEELDELTGLSPALELRRQSLFESWKQEAIVSWWVYPKELKITMVFTICMVTDTIQVRTITNLVIPLQTGGILFHSAPSWPARNYGHRVIYDREIYRYLFILDDRITQLNEHVKTMFQAKQNIF